MRIRQTRKHTPLEHRRAAGQTPLRCARPLALACLLGLALLCAAAPPARAQGQGSADIVVTKSGDESAPVGGQISYNVVVTGGGPDTATGVVLTDPIPQHTTFVSASASQGTVNLDGTTLTANLGTINPFESASISLTVSINADTPRGTTISNTASATSDTHDPDTSNNSSTAFTAVTGPFAGDMMISEFRFRGPGTAVAPGRAEGDAAAQAENSASDEFVEIYNNTDAPVMVSSPSGGWAVVSSDDTATPKFVIPNGSVIPARGHFLATNSGGYSLDAYPADASTGATGDVTYSGDIPDGAGIALFRTADPSGFNADNRLDAVGFSTVSNPLYREGGGLATPVTVGVEHSFLRQLVSGRPQDTGNNASDFVLVATDGNATLASAQLGAPGPENTRSPAQQNDKVKASPIEPAAPPTSAPNTVRNGSGNSGTLSFRRRWTNFTGSTINRLRFRVVDITTQNTPVAVAPQADLRLVSSEDFTITTSLGTLTVKGTILEQPPQQPDGGGLNSTVYVQLPQNGLAPGDSIDLQLLTNVAGAGRYRIFVNVEPSFAADNVEPLQKSQSSPKGRRAQAAKTSSHK